ncbi:hypothetical protein IIC65_06000, partial [Candidatus Sumerlaeota bacterium]|nr:hypothetical protein [Candidatus Sumerlaeota bacterium]
MGAPGNSNNQDARMFGVFPAILWVGAALIIPFGRPHVRKLELVVVLLVIYGAISVWRKLSAPDRKSFRQAFGTIVLLSLMFVLDIINRERHFDSDVVD